MAFVSVKSETETTHQNIYVFGLPWSIRGTDSMYTTNICSFEACRGKRNDIIRHFERVSSPHPLRTAQNFILFTSCHACAVAPFFSDSKTVTYFWFYLLKIIILSSILISDRTIYMTLDAIHSNEFIDIGIWCLRWSTEQYRTDKHGKVFKNSKKKNLGGSSYHFLRTKWPRTRLPK